MTDILPEIIQNLWVIFTSALPHCTVLNFNFCISNVVKLLKAPLSFSPTFCLGSGNLASQNFGIIKCLKEKTDVECQAVTLREFGHLHVATGAVLNSNFCLLTPVI